MLDRGHAGTSENAVKANFYEKALFVKTDLAVTPYGRPQLLSALRAMLLYALSVSPLFGDSVHYEIRLLGYLGRCDLPIGLPDGGRPSSFAQSPP